MEHDLGNPCIRIAPFFSSEACHWTYFQDEQAVVFDIPSFRAFSGKDTLQ